jgi:hypothetical protein
MSTADELPEEATELARIVIDPSRPLSLRDGAWARLVPIIRQVAEQNASFCRDAVEDAVGVVWGMLDPGAGGGRRKYDPDRGSFRAWCAVVVYRHAVDLWRSGKCGVPGLPPAKCEARGAGARPDDAAEREAFDDILVERKEQLRAALDRLGRELGPSAHGTDYFAVLLLKLRLAMAEQVNLEDVLEAEPRRFAEFLAWCLPWVGMEPARRFRDGWPPLSMIWTNLGECLARPPHCLDGPALCERLSRLHDAVVTPDVWNHWVNRAKKEAQARLAADEWEGLFARFFPDRHMHRRGESEATP